MKKAISILTALSIFMVCIVGNALADNDFSIHGGIHFGMTKQQVIDFEAGKEIELKDNSGNYKVGDLTGSGQFADYSADFYFAFEQDELVSMIAWDKFLLSSDTYYACDATLNEKYGDPVAQNGKYISYPNNGYDAIDLLFDDSFQDRYDKSSAAGSNYGFKIEDSRQRLFKTNTGYADIMHVSYSFVSTNQYGTLKVYGAIISYSYMTEEQYNEYISDTINKKLEEQQSRDTDL